MCDDHDELEHLLEQRLQQTATYWTPRYVVSREGDRWAVRDCEQEPQSGGKVVRLYRGKYIAQSCALFGNMMGACECCGRPATVLVYGRACCIDCVPEGEPYGLIPLDVLRVWRDSEYR